ncbi:PorV/PorQ family protein [Candidatus Aerophobetes bacterium]|nr:PorV/PorQ family protein [Candidatus Aerophobetes bacterium]
MLTFKRKKIFLGLFTGALALSFSAASFASGYVDLNMGPRPQAMGGAFVAVADDVYAGYWNPAGIVQLKEPAVGFMHSNPFGITEVSLDYLVFAHPTALSFLNGGIGLAYQKTAAIFESCYSERTGDESIYTLSVAGKIIPRLSYGINLKSINIDFGEMSTSGEAFDFGLLYRFDERYSLGLMMRNLSGKLTNETLRQEKRLGVAGRFWNNKIIVAIDASHKKEVQGEQEVWRLHAGTELQVTENIALRVGFDRESFTAGVGIGFNLGGLIQGASLDYSFKNSEELAVSHRFALSLALGGMD